MLFWKLKNDVLSFLQGLRGDQRSKTDALTKLKEELDRMHKATLTALIPALNERLKHRCISNYSKGTENLAAVNNMTDYVDLHQRSLQEAKSALRQVHPSHLNTF